MEIEVSYVLLFVLLEAYKSISPYFFADYWTNAEWPIHCAANTIEKYSSVLAKFIYPKNIPPIFAVNKPCKNYY